MRQLVTGLARLLEQGSEAVLAVILDHAGSTPRGSGSMMVVRPDGTMAGSVGGGPLEARVLSRAKDLFQERASCLLRFDLGAREAADAGMVCGGEAVVLLDHLPADPDCAGVFRALAQSLNAGRPTTLATAFSMNGERLAAVSRKALDPDDGDPVLAAPLTLARRTGRPASLAAPGSLTVVIPLAALKTAILFGAGHVALHSAHLAAQVGFRTVVVDDRPEFANAGRFPLADEVRVIPSFRDCLDGMAIGPDTFILILTRGHLHDKTVLAQALDTQAGYLGMIGSRRKRDATYRALEAEGRDPSELERVHCPIGLSIDAETPEEIAVSIVAEMIQVRAGMGAGETAP